MTLTDVECKFDNSKILFYFTADGRVDFRDLVKDLAAVYKTRIELRQIGVRDEVKRIVLFAVGTGLYAAADLGRGSYEAVTFALAEKNHWQVKVVRMILDAAMVVIGGSGLSELPVRRLLQVPH